MTIDPVCGTQVDERIAPATVYKGALYAFCSQACKGSFNRDPQRYVESRMSAKDPPQEAEPDMLDCA